MKLTVSKLSLCCLTLHLLFIQVFFSTYFFYLPVSFPSSRATDTQTIWPVAGEWKGAFEGKNSNEKNWIKNFSFRIMQTALGHKSAFELSVLAVQKNSLKKKIYEKVLFLFFFSQILGSQADNDNAWVTIAWMNSRNFWGLHEILKSLRESQHNYSFDILYANFVVFKQLK